MYISLRSISTSCITPVCEALGDLEKDGIITDEFRLPVQEIYCQMSKTLERHDQHVHLVAALMLIVLPSVSSYCILYLALPVSAGPLFATAGALVIFTLLLRRFYHGQCRGCASQSHRRVEADKHTSQ